MDTRRTWIEPSQELGTKSAFYREHLLQLTADGFIIRPSYMDTHLSHGLRCVGLRCAIGQIRTSSHQLEIETGRFRGIPADNRICRLCHTEPETELHYICHCTVYYEIRGRFHCLFREGFGPLDRVMRYEDQRCLGLYLLEIHRYRDSLLRRHGQRQSQRHISDFYRSDVSQPDDLSPAQSLDPTPIHTSGTLIERAIELGRSRRPRLRRGVTQHRRRLLQRIRRILSRHPGC